MVASAYVESCSMFRVVLRTSEAVQIHTAQPLLLRDVIVCRAIKWSTPAISE